jgi:hypothetical protein
MRTTRLGLHQPDLFAAQPGQPEAAEFPGLAEPPPQDFIQRIREELLATLARVTGAETLPWADPTRAYLAAMRFRSIAGWLPPPEAERLRAAFAHEMARLDP